ncbi:DsbC family protein [Thiomicrorhabdus sp. Milos-T2]|uniref:DsbC family protein n=1 Tax=Thiomicrorhabdus sp. Milos-T2 TaxID=90814 RepID=UPI000494A349|nr:DsbC family protein [Thiomicrorhabdus sp. Milos-T2]
MFKSIKNRNLLGLVTGTVLLCASTVSFATDESSAILKRLQTIVPGDVKEATITETSVQGIYQVKVGLTVVYMSKDGKYLLNGNMIDLDSGKNLTKVAVAKARKTALDGIDESSLIIYPAKQGKDKAKHTITVFTDVDCPYCKKFHKEIPVLNEAGVNVRYISFPRAGVGSPSYFKAVSVWCAKNPQKAMSDAMNGAAIDKTQCKNPINKHLEYAQEFEVNGTPNILLENGTLLPGYVPAKKLLQVLSDS